MAIDVETGSLATYTAQDIIKRAYKVLGDIDYSESLTAEQANDGLEALNTLFDSYSIDRSAIYQIRQESFTWPASTTSRTIGPAGDFVTRRPTKIEAGTYFTDSNAITYPVVIIRDRSTYDGIDDKTVSTSYPSHIFLDTSVAESTLYVYPVPVAELTLYLNVWQPLQVFDSLTEALVMPAGYRRFAVYNLAKELSPEVGLPLPQLAVQIAVESLEMIKRANYRPVYSSTETAYALDKNTHSDIVSGI